MTTGAVKWFNGQRDLVSFSRMTAATTCSCTSARLNALGYLVWPKVRRFLFEIKVDTKRGKSSAENLRLG
jgi:hypothetical protein